MGRFPYSCIVVPRASSIKLCLFTPSDPWPSLETSIVHVLQFNPPVQHNAGGTCGTLRALVGLYQSSSFNPHNNTTLSRYHITCNPLLSAPANFKHGWNYKGIFFLLRGFCCSLPMGQLWKTEGWYLQAQALHWVGSWIFRLLCLSEISFRKLGDGKDKVVGKFPSMKLLVHSILTSQHRSRISDQRRRLSISGQDRYRRNERDTLQCCQARRWQGQACRCSQKYPHYDHCTA